MSADPSQAPAPAQEDRGELLFVHLHGPFDLHAAGQLARRLERLPPTGVVLDFSGICSFRDAGVAVAAQALRPHRVALRGLSRHPTRVFHAFGIGRETPSPHG